MVKINDIVKLVNCDGNQNHATYLGKIGLVIKGPYEDSIRISNDCTMICLVCDVMIGGIIIPGVPTQNLSRVRQ
jgi:hypothetical protein